MYIYMYMCVYVYIYIYIWPSRLGQASDTAKSYFQRVSVIFSDLEENLTSNNCRREFYDTRFYALLRNNS